MGGPTEWALTRRREAMLHRASEPVEVQRHRALAESAMNVTSAPRRRGWRHARVNALNSRRGHPLIARRHLRNGSVDDQKTEPNQLPYQDRWGQTDSHRLHRQNARQ